MKQTLLVIGREGTGKTYQMVQWLKGCKKILVITAGSLNTWIELGVEFDFIIPESWTQIQNEVVAPLNGGKLVYDAVVFEDYGSYATVVMNEITGGGQATMPQWGELSRKLMLQILSISNRVAKLGITTQVVDEQDKTTDLNINRRSRLDMVALMGQVWCCFTRQGKDGLAQYAVQTNKALAMQQTPPKAELIKKEETNAN